MPSKKYILKYGESTSLEISWGGGWFRLRENFRIRYKGQLIGEFPTRSELEKGQQFQLPDDSTLEIELVEHRFNILLDGRMVQDTPYLKGVLSSTFILAFGILILGLSTYTTRYYPLGSHFYQYINGSRASPPTYLNMVGPYLIGLAFLYAWSGYLANSKKFFGYLGLSFLVCITLLIFRFIFSSFIDDTIRANLSLLWLLSLCIFANDIRKFQLQRKKRNEISDGERHSPKIFQFFAEGMMPSTKYVLKYGEPAPLEITWSGGWFRLKENFRVRYNGQLVGEFSTRSDLETPKRLQLPDGSILDIKIVDNSFSLLYNEKLVEYIPDAKTAQLYAILFALLLTAIGLLTFMFKISSWEISFNGPQLFRYTIASPLYVNLVGSSSLILASLFFVESLLVKRSQLLGYAGFSFLVFICVIVFSLIVPSLLGESVRVTQYVYIFLLSFYFVRDLYMNNASKRMHTESKHDNRP